MKRQSWLELFVQTANDGKPLPALTRDALSNLDQTLYEVWSLGDNLVLAWTRLDRNLCFLAVRHYAIVETFGGDFAGDDNSRSNEFINELLAGPKCHPPAEFERIRRSLGDAAHIVDIGIAPGLEIGEALVDAVVTRYGVSLVRERAVVLLDVVGFSRRAPLEQLAMLNSLNYSVNSAFRQLQSRDIHVDFARTTTGDGFYIWNRAHGAEATVALYELMMLILADNAVAQRKAKRFPVPTLRAAFHVGEHYEFYQVEGLNPTAFGYIVGQVTIDLSRLIEKALPGQILLGEFAIDMEEGESEKATKCSTQGFVLQAADRIAQLRGLTVGDDLVDTIRCYLTGPRKSDGVFLANRYAISDKHEMLRYAFNAKINIHLVGSKPIFLGMQHKDLHRNNAWP
jgi:hypothetical protein